MWFLLAVKVQDWFMRIEVCTLIPFCSRGNFNFCLLTKRV